MNHPSYSSPAESYGGGTAQYAGGRAKSSHFIVFHLALPELGRVMAAA